MSIKCVFMYTIICIVIICNTVLLFALIATNGGCRAQHGEQVRTALAYLSLLKQNAAQFSTYFLEEQSDRVTRIIHQSWKNAQVPPRFARWQRSWTNSCFPQWEYKFWTDIDNRNFIANEFPWYLFHYDNYVLSIHKADIVRYFYMYKFGGVYVDLDNECLKPFDTLLERKPIVLGAMFGTFYPGIHEGYVQNSFMYSVPKHPFWLHVIEHSLKVGFVGVESATGPILLMQAINTWRDNCSDAGGTDNVTTIDGAGSIHIYPPIYFNPFSWYQSDASSNCSTHNSMSEMQLQNCRQYYKRKGSYVIQYHTNTWSLGTVK